MSGFWGDAWQVASPSYLQTSIYLNPARKSTDCRAASCAYPHGRAWRLQTGWRQVPNLAPFIDSTLKTCPSVTSKKPQWHRQAAQQPLRSPSHLWPRSCWEREMTLKLDGSLLPCLLKQKEVWVSSPALPKASLSVQPQMGALVLPATEDQGTISHVQEWFVPSWTPWRSLLSLP